MARLAKLSSFFALVLISGLIGVISAKSVAQKTKLDDEKCVLCEFVMKELEGLISSNATEQEIKAALEKVCSLLPTTIQEECTRLIDDYAVEIIDLLVQEATPEMICKLIKLCPSDDKKSQVTIPGPQCEICKMLMGKLADMLTSNATEAEIEAELDKVCSLLPSSYKTECDDFVKEYTPIILQLLTHEVAPEAVCALLQLCSTNKVAPQVVQPKADNCVLCEFIMKEVDSLLSDNATQTEIEAALEKVCSLLPSTIGSECNDFIQQYVHAILQLLSKDVSPEEICTILTFCSSKSVQKKPITAVFRQKAVQTKKVALPVVQPEAGQYCVICEFIMKEVDSLLSNNATEAEIEAALEKVCSLLPSTIQSDCDDFIQQYVPAILQLLSKDVSPEEICTILTFCSSKSVQKKPVMMAKPKVALKQVAANDSCVLCEFVMREVDSLLSDNATEEEITQVIENICTILPGTLREQCDSFLNTYGPALITLIVQQLDPEEVCTKIGLCSETSKVYTYKPSKSPVKNDEECAFCEFIMAELKDLISKNSTEEEIKQALDDVCGILPSQFEAGCIVFVNQYADAIIQLLLNEIDPTQICTALQFCTSTVAMSSDDECDLCQLLVKFADDFVRSNSTEEEIVKGLLDVCSILPSTLKDKCTSIIGQYGTVIPGLITQLLSPLKVCETLGICSQGKLGASLCSRGPTAWCATMENAKMCNAVSHCQRHVWN